jgi:putative transposase
MLDPIERLNGEIRRRTDDVGILPNDKYILRLNARRLLEQSDGWAFERARYMTLETSSQMSDVPLVSLPIRAR